MLNLSRWSKSLCLRLRYSYEQLPADTYFINQRDTHGMRHAVSSVLTPLKGSNHGAGLMSGDEITLTGVPYGVTKQKYEDFDVFNKLNMRLRPDLVFLQMDPSHYIARQRFLAHKCALQGVDDYRKEDCAVIDPLKPHAWEECVVNLTVLDMLRENKNYEDIDWTKGFATYAYPEIQEKAVIAKNTQLFVNSIDEHIVGHKYSEYYMINAILYAALMGKHKVLLGDMPDPLYKMNIGNTLELGEARDIFKYTIQNIKSLEVPISMRRAALDFMPHIFQTPRDLYMTAMLKEAFQASETMVAYVGLPHMMPIENYWVGSPYGINYTEATRIPPRRTGEIDEQLIEKQALLDVLLETHTWAQPSLSNPFPYLVDDITSISPQSLKAMKDCFFMHYAKYSAYKDQAQKELPHFKNDKDIQYLENKAIPDIKRTPIEVKAYKDKQLQKIQRIQIAQQ